MLEGRLFEWQGGRIMRISETHADDRGRVRALVCHCLTPLDSDGEYVWWTLEAPDGEMPLELITEH